MAPLFGPSSGKVGTRPHGTECSTWNAGWTENRESEAFEMARTAVVWRAQDRDGVDSKNGTELENESRISRRNDSLPPLKPEGPTISYVSKHVSQRSVLPLAT